MFENGEIRPINVQGTANNAGGVTIYAPQKGNRAIINQININFPVAYTISLYRKSALTGKPMLLYKLSLNAGDIIDDGVGYNLDEGDSLYLVADEGAVNWSVEGWEYEKHCLNLPTSGRGQLKVIDSSGNYKGIGQQGPPGPAGEGSVTSAAFIFLESRVSGNSAQMESADAALSLRIDAVSVGAASVTSAEYLSLVNRVSGNSTQMTSADDAISAAVVVVDARVTSVMSAVSVESAARAAADTSLDGRITSVMSAVSVESAARAAADTSLDGRITSVMSAVSVESAARAAADTSLDGRITSVMSAVSVESAARAAADTSLDGRITSVMSAVSVESAARAGADISIMSAVSVESAARAAADTSLDGRITSVMSAVSTESASRAAADTSLAGSIAGALSAIAANSAQMTSAFQSLDNIGDVSVAGAIDGQALIFNSAEGQWVASTMPGGSGSVTSAEHLSLVERVSGISTEITNVDGRVTSVMSAVSVESAARAAADTSLDGRITSVMSAVSVESAARAAADTSLDGRITSVMSAVSSESAARAAADTSLDGRVTSVMSAVSVESAARAGADISIMSAVSVESAARAAADTSLDGRITSVMSAVSVESAARAGADISIMSAVSVESAARAAADTSLDGRITSVVSVVSTLQYPAIESVASAVYSVVEADRGKIKYFTNATSIEVILGDGLTSGFQAVIWRASAAGELKISAVTGLESQGTVLSTINTAATIIHKGGNIWIAAGAFAGGGGGGSVTSAEVVAVDNRVTSVMSAVSTESAVRAAQAISIMSAVSVESAARAGADTSLDGRITSVMTAVSTESAARAAADTSLDGRITSLGGSVAGALSAIVANSAQFTSFKQSIDNLGDVSATGATSLQVLTFISGQWVAANFTSAGGIISVTSAELSAVSANAKSGLNKGGGIVLNIVADAQGISGTGLTKISGLSVTFSTGGIYQIHAHIAYFVSVSVGNVRFGITHPGAVQTHGMVWGNRNIGTGIVLSTFMVHGAFNFTSAGNTVILSTTSVVSAVNTVGIIMDALVISAVAGSFEMMAAVSTTAMPINILPGSFIRAYKLN